MHQYRLNADHIKEWIELAIQAKERAYAPYSRFQVGSALIGGDGTIYLGCNVENAAYGPSNCAERTALFRAIADGCRPRSFKVLIVTGDTPEPITPCGTCRQVMAELCAPEMPVILSNTQGDYRITSVAELLPGAFSLNDHENQRPVREDQAGKDGRHDGTAI